MEERGGKEGEGEGMGRGRERFLFRLPLHSVA